MPASVSVSPTCLPIKPSKIRVAQGKLQSEIARALGKHANL